LKTGKDLDAWMPELDVESLRVQIEEKRQIKLTWKTITPRTPYQGGRWERMVRSMKRALSVTQNANPLKEDEFRTLLLEACDMLNSRPVTEKEGDHLTPNHFLFGRMSVSTLGTCSTNAQYTRIQETVEKLWKRFTEEILVDNREAPKWVKDKENITIGDLVIVMDPSPMKGEWKLGVVTKVFPGRDGKVRNLKLRMKEELFQRSVFNLIPIPKWRGEDLLDPKRK